MLREGQGVSSWAGTGSRARQTSEGSGGGRGDAEDGERGEGGSLGRRKREGKLTGGRADWSGRGLREETTGQGGEARGVEEPGRGE